MAVTSGGHGFTPDLGIGEEESKGVPSLHDSRDVAAAWEAQPQTHGTEYSRQFSDPAHVPTRNGSRARAKATASPRGDATYSFDVSEKEKIRKRNASRTKESDSEYGRQFSQAWTTDQQTQYEANSQQCRDRKTKAYQSQPLEWVELSSSLNSLLEEVGSDNEGEGAKMATAKADPVQVAQTARVARKVQGSKTVKQPVSKTVRRALGIVNGTAEPDSARKRQASKKHGKDIFIAYGGGNTSPCHPEHAMRTHNVKAPVQELVPYTTERVARARSYDEQRKMRRQQYYDRARAERFANLNPQDPGPDNKTEYQRRYMDWRNYVKAPNGQWVKK